MSRFEIELTSSAKSDWEALDRVTRKIMAKKLQEIRDSGNPLQSAETLLNHDIGNYRFRIGDYRIAFDLIGFNVVILRIRHRSEAYKVAVNLN